MELHVKLSGLFHVELKFSVATFEQYSITVNQHVTLRSKENGLLIFQELEYPAQPCVDKDMYSTTVYAIQKKIEEDVTGNLLEDILKNVAMM